MWRSKEDKMFGTFDSEASNVTGEVLTMPNRDFNNVEINEIPTCVCRVR